MPSASSSAVGADAGWMKYFAISPTKNECSHGLDTAALGAAIAMVVAAAFCARFFRGVRVVSATEHEAATPAALQQPARP
jgi:hypothetical protein